jgi:hypothetical protein
MRLRWLVGAAFDFWCVSRTSAPRLIFVFCSPTLRGNDDCRLGPCRTAEASVVTGMLSAPTFFELMRVFQRRRVAFTRGLQVVFVLHSRKIS